MVPPNMQRFPFVAKRLETTKDSGYQVMFSKIQKNRLGIGFDDKRFIIIIIFRCKFISKPQKSKSHLCFYQLLAQFQLLDILQNQVKLANIVKS